MASKALKKTPYYCLYSSKCPQSASKICFAGVYTCVIIIMPSRLLTTKCSYIDIRQFREIVKWHLKLHSFNLAMTVSFSSHLIINTVALVVVTWMNLFDNPFQFNLLCRECCTLCCSDMKQ